jgi:hypothetical protein
MPTEWARSTSDAMAALALYVQARSEPDAASSAAARLEAMIEQYGAFDALSGMTHAAALCLRHVFDDTGAVVRRRRERRGHPTPTADDPNLQLDLLYVWRKYLTAARADEVERQLTAADLERWLELGGDDAPG